MARDDDRGRSRGFQYRERDPEEIKRRAQGISTNDSYLANNLKIYKAPEGDNTVRVLPPTWADARHYGLDIHIHYGIGSDNAAYLCLEKMKGKACPICEARAKAMRAGDEEYAQELRPNYRVLMYILDREKERDGVQVWSIGNRMDQDISLVCTDKKTGETLFIDNPETGYDLSFDRKGQGMKTRYSGIMVARRSSPLDNDKALQFIQDYPLDEQLIYYSYDHIQKAFAGSAKDDDDEKGSSRERVRDSARDRDDDKPARTRDKDTDDDRSRKPTRDDDDRPARGSARSQPDLPTWDEVHALKFRKLEELINEHRLKVDPNDSRDDEELADMICDELGISDKPVRAARDETPVRTRTRVEPDIRDEDVPSRGRARAPEADDDDPREKLRSMRRD